MLKRLNNVTREGQRLAQEALKEELLHERRKRHGGRAKRRWRRRNRKFTEHIRAMNKYETAMEKGDLANAIGWAARSTRRPANA
jgi:O-methyltransferase involved in polyketide biosynthesis